MDSIFKVVEDGQKGNNSAIEVLSGMDWFRACISEQLDSVWMTYGGKMFADVFTNMDYDYVLTLLSFMVAKQVSTPTEGNDINTRLGTNTDDRSSKNYVRKYIRNGAFKGEWNKVFYSYAYETHPSIGNNVSAFKRNLNVYIWFLSNSVNRSDVDKTDEEIIASIDLEAINKRYGDVGEEITTLGDAKKAMKSDLTTLRMWFKDMGDFGYADANYNTQDVLDTLVDETILATVKGCLIPLAAIHKECYLRHIINKESGPKVADILGISETSVRRYCTKVKNAIDTALSEIEND